MSYARTTAIDPREELYALELIQKIPDNISYIEADGNDSYIINQYGYRYFIRRPLNQIQKLLFDDRFLKCSNDCIINIDSVQELWVSCEPIIVMSSGNVISVSTGSIFKIKKILEKKVDVGWDKSSCIVRYLQKPSKVTVK